MRNFKLLTGVAAAALLAGMSVASADPVNLNIDDINQQSTNRANVTNHGEIDQSSVVSGNGASLSISAAGAIASASVSSINSPEFDNVTIGTLGANEILSQTTRNDGDIRNYNSGSNNQLDASTISGDGASISVSATGGASAVSLSSVNNQNVGLSQDIVFGGIDQNTVNTGHIYNSGGEISTGNISGDGASASIGASGAVSSVSVSSIVDSQQLGDVTVVADIDQNTTNTSSGSVSNYGTINAGALTGQGASASVSAIGAASAVSFSTISQLP